jgi:hypothetical protein
MWAIKIGIELVGILLNLFMSLTWLIAGNLSKQAFQVKFCVGAGLLLFLVGTLPSLVLKYELPCGCETEEWYDIEHFCVIFGASNNWPSPPLRFM